MATKKRVLVVEDCEFVREMIQFVLEQSGMQVITAADGEMGLTLAALDVPDFIVMDWMMPKVSGNELLDQLKKNPRTSNIPVIVVSARALEQNMASDIHKFHSFIPKDEETLFRLVDELQQFQAVPV